MGGEGRGCEEGERGMLSANEGADGGVIRE